MKTTNTYVWQEVNVSQEYDEIKLLTQIHRHDKLIMPTESSIAAWLEQTRSKHCARVERPDTQQIDREMTSRQTKWSSRSELILPTLHSSNVESEKWLSVNTNDKPVRTDDADCEWSYTDYCTAFTVRHWCNDSSAVSLLYLHPKQFTQTNDHIKHQ